MYKTILLVVGVLLFTFASAQETKTIDQVHLKIGKVLEGKVIETKPGEYIIFQPSGKDADQIYIKEDDIIKIVQVEVKEKEKIKKVFYANYSYLAYNYNLTTKDTVSNVGVYFSNGILIQINPSFGFDLGVVVGLCKGSRLTGIPVMLNIKLNKTFSDKITGFYYIEGGIDFYSYKNQYKNDGYFNLIGGSGVGVKLQRDDKLSVFSAIGVNRTMIETPRITNYYVNETLYRTDVILGEHPVSFLQLSVGINF